MLEEILTPWERVRLAFSHQETDRVPVCFIFGCNTPAKIDLMKYLGLSSPGEVDSLFSQLDDIRTVHPRYVGPPERTMTLADGTRTDEWGVTRKPVSYGSGHYDEIAFHPLEQARDISDLDKYTWPDISWWDFSVIPQIIKRCNGTKRYAIKSGGGPTIYESAWYMRGFEKMFVDFADNPELAYEIMRRVTDFRIAFQTKMLEVADGMIDIVFTADDVAGQCGPLMSIPMWKELIKPHHSRLNKVIHEHGAKVMYHSDGAVMGFVEEFIDMGIDSLQALQFDANDMDPTKMKSLFGDRLVFTGGISVQSTLPHGSEEDVEKECKSMIDILGEDGGYIYGPSHAIQAGTPPRNIIKMLEVCRDHKKNRSHAGTNTRR